MNYKSNSRGLELEKNSLRISHKHNDTLTAAGRAPTTTTSSTDDQANGRITVS